MIFVARPGFLQLGSCMPLDFGGFLSVIDVLCERIDLRTARKV